MDAMVPRRLPGTTLVHLEQLIDTLIAGVILMDPAGVILSANPAALKMHGVTQVADLGVTADDYVQRFSLRYRNNHRLKRREYPLMRLLAGESFPDLVVEVSPLGQEEPRWVHQVRDVAMDDDGDGPDCLALIIHDVSERYDAEARFEAMFHANPAPALIIRVADQRILRVNQGFIDLSGFASGALTDKSLYTIDLFAGIERRDFVRERIGGGETVPQLEAELPLAGGGTKLVLVAGQPIEVADERCMLFTFADLEPRRHAESARDASEAHFAKVFQLAPVGMVVTQGADYRIVEVNEAFGQLAGYAVDEVVGKVADDLQLWGDAAQRRTLEAEIEASGAVRGQDIRVLHKEGEQVDCLFSATRISRRGEPCVIWIYQDITTRRHDELALVEAIDAVMQDASWFGRSIMDKLAALRRPAAEAATLAPITLSRRESEVLELICQGVDDAAIGVRLSLSPNTVRNHVARLYAKIGVNRRGAAILWARERGIY
ncbi:MAG: PAS domain S-box protein [Bradyrhizobium sp.]